MIKEKFSQDDMIEVKMDYHDLGMMKLLKGDIKTYDIGMMILTNEMFKKVKISNLF